MKKPQNPVQLLEIVGKYIGTDGDYSATKIISDILPGFGKTITWVVTVWDGISLVSEQFDYTINL